jgi:hypothetical protein
VVGAVGQPDVQRLAVGVAEHGDGPNTQVLARPDDAYGDLATVGDKDAPEHAGLWSKRPWSKRRHR